MAATPTAVNAVANAGADDKKGFGEWFVSTDLQPQMFSMILVTIILIIFAIVVYKKVKKQKPNVAPSGLIQVTEMYVMGVDNLYKTTTEEKFNKPAPYIFTLITFLLLSNIMGLLGLEPPTTSLSVTLTLGLISWIGIYVVGLMYQKWSFFKKYLNPLELLSQFSPLISISFRLFGNMMAGSIIMTLIYSFTGWIWGFIPVIGEMNILGSFIAPALHVYFDIFDGLVQALVFTLLTMIYWTLEAEVPATKEKSVKTKNIKKLKTVNA